jgi:N6-adenosine-specific RNA methylase IME4
MSFSKPLKRYGVIYADPPWNFKNYSEKGTGRNAVAHYQCMDFDALAALKPQRWAAKDCVLLMWATDPLLAKAFDLIKAWGFTYKTVGFYWAKTNKRANLNELSADDFFTGLGYWTRANVEQCLLATRGSPPRMAKNVRRLIIQPRREHSRKPDEVYGRIERLSRGPYLEMFARRSRPRWDAWGDQVGLLDAGPVPTRNRPSNMGDAMHQFALRATSVARRNAADDVLRIGDRR